MPFKDRKSNYLEIFNEACIYMISLLILSLKNYEEDESSNSIRKLNGNYIIFIVIIVIFINIYNSLSFKDVKNRIMSMKRRI